LISKDLVTGSESGEQNAGFTEKYVKLTMAVCLDAEEPILCLINIYAVKNSCLDFYCSTEQ
jgi:hypothetical protein